RGYAQRDPLVEYQKESYSMFERLIGSVESEVVKKIYRLNPVAQPAPTPQMVLRKDEIVGAGSSRPTPAKNNITPQPITPDIGRNDPCPCGSGKKWKKCGMIGAKEHHI
ncbi:MAG: SEC-C metal-binding domain-containing protein, partial [bacterium]